MITSTLSGHSTGTFDELRILSQGTYKNIIAVIKSAGGGGNGGKLDPNLALVTNAQGKTTTSTVTTAELDTLKGVTAPIQAALDSKVSSATLPLQVSGSTVSMP